MKSKLFQIAIVLAVVVMAVPSTLVMAAAYPEPTYVNEDPSNPPLVPAPVIDGSAAEWLPGDFFANLYEAGDPTKPVMAKLYARYDCGSGYLYVLVMAEPGLTVDAADNADVHFVKLGTTKLVDANSAPPNGTQPEFAFVGLSGGTAAGWEASMFVAQGNYTNFNVHTNVLDPASQTAAVENRAIQLLLDCTPPTAVDMASFTAEVAGPAIQVSWETVSEVNSLGFNLYRATAAAGTRVKLNAGLLPTQVPGSPVGATYSFLDKTAERGVTYYYWLEAVGADGANSIHGPATATLKAYVKVLPGRPRPLPAPVIQIP